MSETPIAAAPELFLCDGCGQSDTAPMTHILGGEWKKDERTTITNPSFHFDCLPQAYRDQLYANGVPLPQHANTVAAIAAAESGTKNDALREFIQAQPDDNNIELIATPDPTPLPEAIEPPAASTEGA